MVMVMVAILGSLPVISRSLAFCRPSLENDFIDSHSQPL